jgi:hypothetical protein
MNSTVKTGPLNDNNGKYILLSVEEAFQVNPVTTACKRFQFVSPTFFCEHCCHAYRQQIFIGSDNYIDHYADPHTRDWYSTDVIESLSTLAAHNVHNPSVWFVQTGFAQSQRAVIEEESVMQVPSPHITTIISVVYKKNHYAVLQADLRTRHVTVHDGYLHQNGEAQQWSKHARFLLQRCNQQLPNCTDLPSVVDPLSKPAATGKWTISLPIQPVVIQRDDDYFSCGPLACLTVLFFLHGEHGNGERFRPSSLKDNEYRRVAMEEYRRLVTMAKMMPIDMLAVMHHKKKSK